MNAFLNLFEQRVRGIRLIELIGLALALGMIFWVCLSKAREGEDIKRMVQIDQQIAEESQAVAALRVRVSQLERPARLEALATAYLGMKPVSAAHETPIDSIGEISRATSRPVQVAASAPVVTPVAAPAPSEDDLISTGHSAIAVKTVAAPAKATIAVTTTGQKAAVKP